MLKHHKYVIESAKKTHLCQGWFYRTTYAFTPAVHNLMQQNEKFSIFCFDYTLWLKIVNETASRKKYFNSYDILLHKRTVFLFVAILRRIHRTFHCVLCTNIFTCSASIYALRTCPTCLSVPITPMQVSGGGDELELQLESSISTNCVTNKIFFEPALRVLFIRKSEGIVKKACDTCTWVVWHLTWKKLTSYRKLWRIFKK